MIIAFIGDIGSGKTLSMIKYLLEKYNKGHNLFVNLHLDFPKHKKSVIQNLDGSFFKDYSKSGFNIVDSVVAIDEAHVFFDSRNAMMKKNKIFSRFVTQSRKRTVDLIYTTQDKSPELFITSGQVELRLRKLTDYIIFCEKIKVGKNIFISQSICDHYGKQVEKVVFLAEPYFKLYDTNEIIDFDEADEDD